MPDKIRLPSRARELEAFDKLPTELRNELNYAKKLLDPRQVLGILKTQGLDQALSYVAAAQEVR